MEKMIGKIVMAFFVGLLALLFSGAIYAVFTMLLWNWLMSEIFGLPEIGFWPAFGINLLTEIFFRGATQLKTTIKDGEM